MYVKATNGTIDQFPYTISDLRRDNPNTSFPKRISNETLADWGVYPVQVLDQPSYDRKTQNLERNDNPTLSDGSWQLGWFASSKSSEEVTQYNNDMSDHNKAIRNQKLDETDWWAVSDRTMTSEQITYRQALRDITTHANWPHLNDDDWPTKP